MISKDIALEKVNSYLKQSKANMSYDIVVLEDETMEFEFGWLFFVKRKSLWKQRVYYMRLLHKVCQ